MDYRTHRQLFVLPGESAALQQQTRKVLDDRYLVHRTIGEGRYAK